MEQFEQPPAFSQEQTQYQPPVPEQKHFVNKKFVVTFVVLILLGASTYGGIWRWGKQSAEVVVPTFTPRPDPTADWQTYRNELYGFEFKYPKVWHLFVNAHGSSAPLLISFDTLANISHEDNDLPYALDIGVYTKIDLLDHRKLGVNDLADYIGKYSSLSVPELVNIQQLTFGEIVVYKADAGQNVFSGGSFYYFEHGRLIFEFDTFLDDLPELDQILSTFRFLDSEICIQVITPARNPKTGEVRDFPTPCDVPEGWTKI